jgi:hypothetical protein
MKSIAAAAVVLACLAVHSASAFVSQSNAVRTPSALAVSFEDELGAQKPLGYW